MTDNTDFTPELTLTPDTAAAAQAPQAPNLTLEPTLTAEDAAAAQKARDEHAVKLDESQLTDAERKMVNDFSEKIDITDSNMVLQYGAAAQKNIASFSENTLNSVRTKDLGEVGDALAGLVGELQNFGQEEKKGVFGFFQKKKNDLNAMKAQYAKAETNVEKIQSMLEGHQVQLLKDIAMLDRLYEQNLKCFKELSMYIAAGKQRLESFRANELQQAYDKANSSGLPEDAQAAKDLSDKADRFEKKLYDLELTRDISIQTAPQIRMIQSSNQLMAEKIQTSIVNTIPLWKSQMVMALGIAHTQKAINAQRSVTDLTNELLQKNAQKLHMASVESAREAERGIVDIETLKKTNQQLIETMDEVLTIQQQGKEKRRSAEKELAEIETQLRKKILEIRQ